jgi:hypothetical protein
MPATYDDFLWSVEPKTGVFAIASPAEKRSLSDEQFRFAFDVVRFAPLAQSLSSFYNAVRQFGTIGLNEFYFGVLRLDFFRHKIPLDYFNQMTRGRILFNEPFLDWTTHWFFVTYVSSIAGILLVWLAWPFLRTRLKMDEIEGRRWYQVLTISVLGVTFNAVICGALAVTSTRFQTRVAWIPLFVLLLLIASRGKRKLT